MQATHTISATFTASAATITASAGAGGSISPTGAQTVAIGGNMTYTITPNNGYHVATCSSTTLGRRRDLVPLHDVTANHTIAATFAVNPPIITVTAPPAGGSYAQQTSLPVTWTTGGAGLRRRVRRVGRQRQRLVHRQARAQQRHHLATATNVTLDVPVGASYRIVVGYRPTVGSGAFTTFA